MRYEDPVRYLEFLKGAYKFHNERSEYHTMMMEETFTKILDCEMKLKNKIMEIK